jgi:hypothetical protein
MNKQSKHLRKVFCSLFLAAVGGNALAGLQVVNSVGTNLVGASTGSTNWGVHTTCPDPLVGATCDANLGNGYFDNGAFSHFHYFDVPTALPGYQGDASAVSNVLTLSVNASGTVSLYHDLGVTGTAETAGPDINVGSFTFSSGVTFAQAQLQTIHFDGLVAGQHYYYWVNGLSTGGTGVNSYQLNSQLYVDPNVVSAVPEPAEWVLMICGLLGVGTLSKFRKVAQAKRRND